MHTVKITKNPDNFLSRFYGGISSPEASGEPETHELKIIFGNNVCQDIRIGNDLFNKDFTFHSFYKFLK